MQTIIELTEKVLHFGVREDHVEVTFLRSAAAYRISPARADFAALVGAIAAAWQAKKPVRVDVDRAVEIVRVSEV